MTKEERLRGRPSIMYFDKEGDAQNARVGAPIIYHDVKGVAHGALITKILSREGQSGPCVNLVFISEDEAKTDAYGRPVERVTSVPHVSTGALNLYFRFEPEAPNERLPEPLPVAREARMSKAPIEQTAEPQAGRTDPYDPMTAL